MKKIVLSTIAALAVSVTSLSASQQFYVDDKGQVFTTSASDRMAIKNEETSVFSKSDKLQFSGQTFIGFKSTDYKDSTAAAERGFEIRRGYFQLKAYLLDDPKSYYRVTFDLKQDTDIDGGSMVLRAKYAYLNLNEVLPFTSLEIGLAHRPWHDYEEHNSWLYRSISEVLVEDHNGAHLANSADFGVMAKTRTKFLDADIGIFNGEGYHEPQANNNGMSLEWRFTGHLLGTAGKPEKNTYLDASFFGQLNKKHDTVSATQSGDLDFYGFHTVYNMPAFLASAQYITSGDTSTSGATPSTHSGDGYSFNLEGRLGAEHQYKAFARYDTWTAKVASGATEYAKKTTIVGAAWKQNKNVEWIANATINSNEYATGGTNPGSIAYMLTTEINF